MSNLYIPPAVIVEIFLRSPIKHILRYKSVCKLWKIIIEDPLFVFMHLNKINKPHAEKFLLECCTIPLTKTTMYGFLPVDKNGVWTTSKKPESWFSSRHLPEFCSCNGLICQQIGKDTKFRIINPLYSIFDVVEVEAPSDEPRLLIAAFGFGFDESSRRFKIVCFVRNNEDLFDCSFKLLVYELGGSNKSWRKSPQSSLGLCSYIISFCNGKSSVFLDGCIHWVAHISNGSESWRSIASFNLSTETLEFIRLPLDVLGKWCHRSRIRNLFDFNGSLGLVVGKVDNEVYVFCKDGSIGTPKKWIKKFSISKPWEHYYSCHIEWVDLLRGCDVLIKNTMGQYINYNTQTGITTHLPQLPKDIGFMCHRGSLIRPSDLDASII